MKKLYLGPDQPAPGLGPFDLLPRSYHYQNRVRQVGKSWLTILIALTAVMLVAVGATVFRTQRNRQMNQQIAAAAIPLLQLRRDVIHLQEEIGRRIKWCQAIEAASPNDDALQTLAAIATACQQVHHEIIVDTVHLRLPIEFPQSVAQRPHWATPLLSVTARVSNEDALEGWMERLNTLDRVKSATIHQPDPLSSGGPGKSVSQVSAQATPSTAWTSAELQAIPMATRVLP